MVRQLNLDEHILMNSFILCCLHLLNLTVIKFKSQYNIYYYVHFPKMLAQRYQKKMLRCNKNNYKSTKKQKSQIKNMKLVNCFSTDFFRLRYYNIHNCFCNRHAFFVCVLLCFVCLFYFCFRLNTYKSTKKL
jgi:hypothetical protein